VKSLGVRNSGAGFKMGERYVQSVYSSVESIFEKRIVCLIAELEMCQRFWLYVALFELGGFEC
jgi:hypothetical protein